MTDTLTISIQITFDGTGEPRVEVNTAAVHPALLLNDSYAETRERVLDAATRVMGSEMWQGFTRTDPYKPATASEIKRALSKKHRVYLDAALQGLVDEGRITAVVDGARTRYLPADNSPED